MRDYIVLPVYYDVHQSSPYCYKVVEIKTTPEITIIKETIKEGLSKEEAYKLRTELLNGEN